MKTIDVVTFCQTIDRDVTEMKSKAHDITNDIARVGSGNGEHGIEYTALLDFLGYVERKLDSLAGACSVELSEMQAAGVYERSGNALNWWFG